MTPKPTTKYLVFFAANLILLSMIFAVQLGNFHGDKSFAFDIVAAAIIIALPIIGLQYPLLKKRKSWVYKSLVFYLSMLAFLFVFGIFISWESKVGGNDAGSWIARLDGGVRLVILGQIFSGALIWYVIVLMINYLGKNFFFDEANPENR